MKNETQIMEQEKSLGLASPNGKPKSTSHEELIEYHEIKDTPFTIARQDKDWFVLMGKYRLTQNLQTKEEAIKEARSKSWIRIMQVINIMMIDHDNEKQVKQN